LILSSPLIDDSAETNFFAAIISQDKEFLNWIVLRLGYFENIDNPSFLIDVKTKNFVSDGIRGTLTLSAEKQGISPLKNYSHYVHPEILLKKNTKFLSLYYKTINKNELKIN
jgi:hypothetical protein